MTADMEEQKQSRESEEQKQQGEQQGDACAYEQTEPEQPMPEGDVDHTDPEQAAAATDERARSAHSRGI